MNITGPSYKCLYPDATSNGTVNVGDVWSKCEFPKALENNKPSLPSPKYLLGGVIISFVLVGDAAFTLKWFMMMSYPQQNLTTEKRVYITTDIEREEGFQKIYSGIMARTWRIYHAVNPVESLILAIHIFHKMLMTSSVWDIYRPAG